MGTHPGMSLNDGCTGTHDEGPSIEQPRDVRLPRRRGPKAPSHDCITLTSSRIPTKSNPWRPFPGSALGLDWLHHSD